MRWLVNTEKIFTRVLAGIISLCFFCIIALIITLVGLRYGLNTTIVGANEFVVILFIYTSVLGAAVIIGKKEHIAITYFLEKLPPALKTVITVNNLILIAFLNGIMIWYSIRWISITGKYLTAVMRIQQIYIQIIIPVGCGIAILYCVYHIILTLTPINKSRI